MKKNKLSVAIVAPSFSEIGGPEVATKNMAHALKKKGVNVVLFAPSDWKINTKHTATLEKSICNMPLSEKIGKVEELRIKSQMEIINHQQKFDIIHLNSQKDAYLVSKHIKKPCLLTFHNKITEPILSQIKKNGVYAVALSSSHGNNLPVDAVIENGIEIKKIKPSFKEGKYLITVGRLTEPKGIDIAIKIANKANKKLLIFGRVGKSLERKRYFKYKIKPFLNDRIVFMGEVSQLELFKHLKKAEALLFPIRRNIKVCPLIIAESLACGTPIIGTPINPTPKILNNPKVACLSKNLNVMVKAAKLTGRFDRKKCREVAENIFDSSIMAEKYMSLYKKIISKKIKNNR